MKTENRIQTSKLPANHTVHWFALIFLQRIAEINMRCSASSKAGKQKAEIYCMNAAFFSVDLHVGMHAFITEKRIQMDTWLACTSVHE